MTVHVARAGSLVAQTAANSGVFRLPWIMISQGNYLELKAAAGDSFIVDHSNRFFQHRAAATGNVRTITEKFDFFVRPGDGEIVMEFRTDPMEVGEGPEIGMEDNFTAFNWELGGKPVSRAGMFRRMAAAIMSPKWNPYGPIPDPRKIKSYNVSFEAGTIEYTDGSSVDDEGASEFPLRMEIELRRPLNAQEKARGVHRSLPPGFYKARPEAATSAVREATHIRFDGRDTDSNLLDAMYVPIEQFEAEKKNGTIVVKSRREQRMFSLERFVVD